MFCGKMKEKNYKKDIKFESNRAYISDPNVSKMFRPIAEEIMRVADKIQNLKGMQKQILKERLEGKRWRELAEKHRISCSTVEYYERAALKKIAKLRPTLIQDFNRIKEMPFSEDCKKERKILSARKYVERNREKRYLSSHLYRLKHPEERKRSYLSYYERNKEEIRRKFRENYSKNKKEYNQKRIQSMAIKQKQDYINIYETCKKETLKEYENECMPFLDILRKKSRNDYKVEEAILALGVRKYRRSFRYILRYLSSPTHYVKNAAIWSFGEMQEIRAISHMLNSIEEDDSRSANEIISSLKRMGHPSALSALKYISSTWPQYKSEAEQAIMHFKFRDMKHEDFLSRQLYNKYLEQLVLNKILTKELLIKAYRIYSTANQMIMEKKNIPISNPNDDYPIPIPVKEQRLLRTRYYLMATNDLEIFKTLMIIEKLRQINGNKFNFKSVLTYLSKAENKR